MFRNYLIIAYRNLSRQKLYATINILGLTIGLTAAILIFLWVRHELSYDKYHQHSDRIYRLVQTQHYSTGPLTTTCMPEPIGRDFKEIYPEVADVFMFYNINAVISTGEDQYNNDVFLAGPSVFKMLDFNFLYGEANQVFDEPGSIVITDETAQKLFGKTDVTGEILKLNNEHSFKITAVIEKIPDNSSVDFDYCIPFEFIENMGFTTGEYGWNTFYCYVELYPETNLIDFQEKIRGHIEEKNSSEGDHIDLFLFPFEKIHLYSVRGDAGAIQYVYIFSAIAFFILLIAGINFMNLSTARSSRRSREIGIRKTFGATRGRLIGQFIGESFLVTLMAALLSILLVYLLLPSFNIFTDKQIGLDWTDPVFLLGLIGMIVFVGFLAGSYPALFLSRFNPLKVLKGEFHIGKGGKNFRRVLVVFQFALSTLLIIASIMIFRQLDYLQNRDPGFSTENVVYMRMSGDSQDKYMVLKNALLKNPDVEYVSRSNNLPFYQGSNSGGFDWEGRNEDEDFLIGFGFFDFDCDSALGLRMKEGRFFDQDFATDSSQAVILNEKAVELTGMEEAVGSWMSWGDNRYYIIGVVEDFHHLPLQYEIDPYAMFLVSSYSRVVLVKLNETGEEQLAFLESAWNEVYPDYPFRYTMLKETYTRVYRDEAKLSRLIRYFAFLAIFITCLGLLGLAAFTAEQRTREIGIRKAFGAGVSQLYILVSKEFIWWVLLANILAWPLAWWILERWLSSFAYHTSISWWIFILSALIGLFIALSTVSYQVWKVTRSNIIDSLRYE